MSLTNSLTSSLISKETSNAAAWAIILAGGTVLLPSSVNAVRTMESFPLVDSRMIHEISEGATSSSISFLEINFDEKPEVDFLPSMPLKKTIKAKVVKERTISFSSDFFD